MAPPLPLNATVEMIHGGTPVAFAVPEVGVEQKPSYYNQAGLPRGAYRRIGNTNLPMTDDEVFSYVSGRLQPTSYPEPVAVATPDDRMPLCAKLGGESPYRHRSR